MITRLPVLDDILETHAAALAGDTLAYRNHCYRVVNFGVVFAGDHPDTLEQLGIAAGFHDLGIWTADTFDYLEPSKELALEFLDRTGRREWAVQIGRMVDEHHKITRCEADPTGLIEAFRKADWIDVTRGVRRFGLSASIVKEVMGAFPNARFHRRLVDFAARRLARHPLNPLPMVRL